MFARPLISLLDTLLNLCNEIIDCSEGFGLFELFDKGAAVVHLSGEGWVEGHATDEGNLLVLCQRLASTLSKYIRNFLSL